MSGPIIGAAERTGAQRRGLGERRDALVGILDGELGLAVEDLPQPGVLAGLAVDALERALKRLEGAQLLAPATAGIMPWATNR